MADSNTPSKLGSKLDSLPKEELIKYIKKQVSQMKDLKKKNEDLNLMLKHEKKEVEKYTNEQKAWLSRGVTAEFEKKEKLEKKERELQVAAQLGQQMLIENDELRMKCEDLEKKCSLVEERFKNDIIELSSEKETIEQTLIMVQNEYKVAKAESQKMKDALETAAAEQDKEHLQWDEEKRELSDKVKDLEDEVSCLRGKNRKGKNQTLLEENKALQEEIDKLQLQIESFKEKESGSYETISRENEELNKKIDFDTAELIELNESVKCLQETCTSLTAKNEELNNIVEMLSVERNGSNNYAEQLVEDLNKTKEEKEKMAKSLKIVRGKLEKASSVEEELKQHINAIAAEKNELQVVVKNVQREKKTIMMSNKKLKDRLKGTVTRQASDESSKEQAIENAMLKKEINEIKIELKDYNEQRRSYENHEKELMEELQSAKCDLGTVEEKLKEAEEKLKEAGEKWKELTKESEDDKSMVLKLQARVDELVSTLQSLNEEKMHQESEIEELFKTQDELQIKHDNECKERKLAETKLQEVLTQLEQRDPAKKASSDAVDSKADASSWDTAWTDGNDAWPTDDSEKPHVMELTNGVTKDDVKHLKTQLQKLQEELDFERQEKKVIESNFRENVSSVDEFEETEKKILQEHEQKQAEINRLQAEMEEIREENVRLNESNGRMNDVTVENEELKKSLETSEGIALDLERKLKNLEVELSETLERSQAQKDVIDALEAKVKEMSEQISSIEAEKLAMTENVSKLTLALDEREEACDVLKEQVRQLDEECRKVRDLENEISCLRETNAEIGEMRDVSTQKLDLLNKKVEEKDKYCSELSDVNSDLQNKVNCCEVEMERMTHKLESLENLLNNVDEDRTSSEELKTRLAEYAGIEQIKNKLCSENDNLNQEISKLRVEVKELSERNNELKIVVASNNSEIDKLRCLYSDEQERSQSLDESTDKLKEEIKELSQVSLKMKDDLQNQIDSCNLLRSNNQEFDDKLLVAETKVSESVRIIESLSSEKTKLSESLGEARVFIKELQSHTGDSEEIVSQLREELSAKNSDIEEKCGILVDKENEVVRLLEEVNEMKKKLAEISADFDKEKQLADERSQMLANKENEIKNLMQTNNVSNSNHLMLMEEKSQALNDKEVEIGHLNEEISELQMKLSSVNDECENSKQLVVNYERRSSELEEKCEMITKMLDSLTESFENEKKYNSRLNLEIEKISNTEKELVEKLQISEDRLSSLENEKKNCELSLEIKTSENLFLSQKMSEWEIEHKSLEENCLETQKIHNELSHAKELLEDSKRECLTKDKEILEYENIMTEKASVMAKLEAELSEMQSKLANQTSGYQSSEQQIVILQQDLEKSRKQIEQLESDNKAKQDKMNKLKSMTIKAKKEVDNVKTKAQTEKSELDAANANLSKELDALRLEMDNQKEIDAAGKAQLKESQDYSERVEKELQMKSTRLTDSDQEIMRLTDIVDKLQISLSSEENKLASVEEMSREREQKMDNLAKQIIEANSRIAKLEGDILEEKQTSDDAKEKLLKVTEDYETIKKESQQMKMMNLEMQDCHRTVETLQSKFNSKDDENQALKTRLGVLQDEIDAKQQEIADLNENNASATEEISKISQLLSQQNDELATLNEERSEMEEKTRELKDKIEQLVQESECRTLQISSLAADKEKLHQQLRNEKELHDRNTQCLETKLSRTQTEVSLLQESYDNCRTDFDNYKIRAQNVLKQQKKKKNQNAESESNEEKSKLERLITQLKESLKEKSEYLATITIEHEDLEAEHEKLNQRYNELIEDVAEKETQWRNRFSEMQLDTKKQLLECDNKLQVLTEEKNAIEEKDADEFESMKLKLEDTITELKEQLDNERKVFKRQNSKSRKKIFDNEPQESSTKSSPPEHFKLLPEPSTDFATALVERPGAEGMDSSELEAVDRPSVPTTPVSADSASILGKLLSPTEQIFPSTWPSSPTFSEEEGRKLRSALATTEKNVEHLSELLAESEGSNLLLDEQVKVLKSEIRRMQQNQEREEALHNLEYLKNVIIKFIRCSPAEKECMVPVLSTMLKLDTDEKAFITEYAKGGPDQADGSGTWSSYVYKWTSFS